MPLAISVMQMSVNIDDWKTLDFDKIIEYSSDLLVFPDYVPVLFLWNANIDFDERDEFLKKNGLYDEVVERRLILKNLSFLPVKTLKMILMRECMSFVEMYPDFQDMIIFIERRK